MKKIYLLAFSLLGIYQINAQVTLTKAANEPIIGNTYDSKGLDSNSTPLPMAIFGSNVLWNFTNLSETGALNTNTFTAPGSGASSYPGATIMQEDQATGNLSYYKSTATTYELLGAELSVGGIGAVLNYNSNSAIISQYPITMGYTNTDPVAGTITASTFSGPFSGTMTTVADGTGTLSLNGSQITNCLRVKTNQKLSFSLSSGLLTGTVDQNIYNYFTSSSKFPVFTVSYTHIVTAGFQVSDQMQTEISALTSTPLAVKENKLNTINFKAYPNPANSEVNIHFVLTQNESYTIDVVNTLGQVVKSVSKPNLQPGVYTENIDLTGLSKGIYHINVKGKNTNGVEKLIIQ